MFTELRQAAQRAAARLLSGWLLGSQLCVQACCRLLQQFLGERCSLVFVDQVARQGLPERPRLGAGLRCFGDVGHGWSLNLLTKAITFPRITLPSSWYFLRLGQ